MLERRTFAKKNYYFIYRHNYNSCPRHLIALPDREVVPSSAPDVIIRFHQRQ